MRYRKLRIAWSVAWGVVCLLHFKNTPTAKDMLRIRELKDLAEEMLAG